MSTASPSRPYFRRWWLSLMVWLLTPLLIVWALQSVSLLHLWETLSQLTILQLAAILAANLLVMLVFSGRWWIVLRALSYPIPYLTLAGYRLSASGVSYFTPGPQFGGEPLQVILLARRTAVPMKDAATSVGLERTLEMLVNFIFLATGVALTIRGQIFGTWLGSGALIIAGGLLLIPAGLLTLLWLGKRPLSWLLFRLPITMQSSVRIKNLQVSLWQSEEQASILLRNQPGAVLAALGFTLVSWTGIIGEYWLVTHLMGLSLTLLQLISILTAARIAFLSPLPSGIGTLEAGQVLTFQLIGLDPSAGLALSILIRARDVLFSGVGLWLGSLWLVDSPAQLR